MARYEQSAQIKAAPDVVFTYVSDMTRHGEWGSHSLDVRKTSEGAVGVGSTFESTAKQFGTQREQQTITAFEPGKRFEFEARGSLGLTRNVFTLEASGEGTKLTKSVEILEPTFLAKALGFRIKKDAPKALAEDVRRITSALEA